MNALAFLLGSRALDLARRTDLVPPEPDAPLGPIASTPETAAAWRRWSEAAHASSDAADANPMAPRVRPEAAAQPHRSPG